VMQPLVIRQKESTFQPDRVTKGYVPGLEMGFLGATPRLALCHANSTERILKFRFFARAASVMAAASFLVEALSLK